MKVPSTSVCKYSRQKRFYMLIPRNSYQWAKVVEGKALIDLSLPVREADCKKCVSLRKYKLAKSVCCSIYQPVETKWTDKLKSIIDKKMNWFKSYYYRETLISVSYLKVNRNRHLSLTDWSNALTGYKIINPYIYTQIFILGGHYYILTSTSSFF